MKRRDWSVESEVRRDTIRKAMIAALADMDVDEEDEEAVVEELMSQLVELRSRYCEQWLKAERYARQGP